MSLEPPDSPTAPQREGSVDRTASRDERLFSNLFASRPPRQRRAGPLAVAAAIHVPLIILLVVTQGKRIVSSIIEITPVLLVQDNPPAIPRPITEQAPPPRGEPSEEDKEQPTRAPIVTPDAPRPGIPQPGQVVVPPPADPVGQPGGVVGGTPGTSSLRDRLTPPIDPRLLAPIAEPEPLVGPAAARARLAERITSYNDSVAAELAAATRATDWTTRDKDGKRWGVSPGKLHLGDITLPLPISFAPPPGRRDEINARVRDWSAIEQGAARAELKDNVDARVKEIRKRKDREREEKRKTTGG